MLPIKLPPILISIDTRRKQVKTAVAVTVVPDPFDLISYVSIISKSFSGSSQLRQANEETSQIRQIQES